MPTLDPPEPELLAYGPQPAVPKRRFGPGALVLSACLAALVGLALGSLGTLALQGIGAFGQEAASGPGLGEGVLEEAEADQSTPLDDAVSACGLDSQTDASLGDDGCSLNLDTKGDDHFSGLDITDVDRVLTELETPDHVLNQINSTRALDGRLSVEWEGMSATWSQHPGSGLNLQLVLE